MPVQPGALTVIDTTVNLTGYDTFISGQGNDRILHNKSQAVMGQFQGTTYKTNPVLRYWFLNGTQGSSYTVISGADTILPYLYDFAYDGVNDQYYMVGLTTMGGEPTDIGLRIFTTDLQGRWNSNFISELDCGLSYNSSFATTYGDYDNGKIMLTIDTDIPDNNLYLKINDIVYKISTASGTFNTTASGVASLTGSIYNPSDGSSTSLNWVGYSGQDYVTYLKYDSILQNTYIERINDDTLVLDSKKVTLSIGTFSVTWIAANNYKLFFNQLDFNTCYFIDTDTSLKEYNVDDLMAAFVAVNVDDAIMPAGTGDTTTVTAEVINAYGDALTSKQVTFAVTGGLGSVSPSIVTTSGGGVAASTFTVGSTTGLATITATVTET